MFKSSLLGRFSEGSGSIIGSSTGRMPRSASSCFGWPFAPGFEKDISTFEEKFMGAMRTHNLWMTPKVHVLIHHVPEYVRRTGV